MDEAENKVEGSSYERHWKQVYREKQKTDTIERKLEKSNEGDKNTLQPVKKAKMEQRKKRIK